jgi:hypothetical protein
MIEVMFWNMADERNFKILGRIQALAFMDAGRLILSLDPIFEGQQAKIEAIMGHFKKAFSADPLAEFIAIPKVILKRPA